MSYWRASGLFLLLSIAPAAAATETVLHSFCQSCADGTFPHSRVKDYNGILYGTTPLGGNETNYNECTDAPYTGCGVVYGIDPATGSETLLFAFCTKNNCNDGAFPEGNPTNVGTKLYGTTYSGGAYGYGTIFSIDPATGAEKVAYSFQGGSPAGGLVAVNGVLYGTTIGGALFSFDPKTGTESVLYASGDELNGDLTAVKNVLYGTGVNVAFSFNLATSQATILHTFGSGKDGASVNPGLIDVNGTLYGTTSGGGAHRKGTLFAIDLASGTESVLYSFCSQTDCADGKQPEAGLLDVNGLLYGTTFKGGYENTFCLGSCGVVFSFDPRTDAETVVYEFCSGGAPCPDGNRPASALVNVNGTLYGTTEWGGAGGGGTVYSLTP